ncbi:hypothetical protein PV05_03374 [Exophiala xenobiotica]|uniref:Uncharacterized protein n=1 Tax=Exophiala xenobiotica TaxID=348802 RepID=A0A0D2C258_9EURO|nr:uncharacterized protein PV05_03374 [Exophiala xenobiotica]KIW58881.1 hypothetical protein PV05_03374 [Exophiala xenobiotica]
MKVYERDSQKELEIYRHFNSYTTEYVGSTLVRTAFEFFDIETPTGHHPCIIHKPLGMSLAGLKGETRRKFAEDLPKLTLTHIFLALDFLRSKSRRHSYWYGPRPGIMLIWVS